MPNTPRVSTHIGALDGLRALAALAVLVTHVGFATGLVEPDLIGSIIARLDVGVPVFFALSGFLLARPWLATALGLTDRKPRLGSYTLRRFARIAPAYWVALAFVLLIAGQGWISEQFASDLTVTTRSVLTHVVVGQGFAGDYFSNFTQTWSLTTEISFYIVLPFLGTLIFRSVKGLPDSESRYRRIQRLCVGTIVLGLAVAAYCATDLPLASASLARSAIGHSAWFAVGVWAAARQLSPTQDVRAPRLGAGDSFVLATLCLLIAASPLGGPLTFQDSTPFQALVREAMYTAIAALTISAAVRGNASSSSTVRFLQSKPMRWLGDRSYALFLWHLPILYALMTATRIDLFSGSFVVIGIFTLTISVLVSDLSWRLVESPILGLVHRHTQLRRQSADQKKAERLRNKGQ